MTQAKLLHNVSCSPVSFILQKMVEVHGIPIMNIPVGNGGLHVLIVVNGS